MNAPRSQPVSAATPTASPGHGGVWGAAVAVFGVVLAVFLPALRNGFINLDDGVYVTSNPHVLGGFTREGVAWAFQTFDSGNWHPVTWLSLMLDAELFGTRPWGFHLSSTVLHALNAALVFVLLRALTGSVWRSLFVALAFGLHPLRVESVAWVSERKDVLSTLFGLLSLLAYARWVRRGSGGKTGSWRYGVLSFGCLALGLMSKPMLVTLPCVFLLLDVWPLGRAEELSVGRVWALIREKIPFFLLTVAGAVSTWVAQASVGAMGSATAYPIGSRLANAVAAYGGYLRRTFWPTELAIIYPFERTHAVVPIAAVGFLLAALTVGTFLLRRSRPWLLGGWLWFLGTLVPVIGLVQVGGQAMADRYTYLPSIGLMVALIWGVAEFAAGVSWRVRTAAVAGVAALTLLAGATVRQIALWKDSPTVFRHALAVTENNYFAHHCLALALEQVPGGRAEALEQYRAALRVVPGLPDAHLELAAALSEAGAAALPECIAEYRAALRLDPRYVEAHYGLARALLRTEDGLPEAITELRRTIELAPGIADAHFDLAECLARTPEGADEAMAEYRTVLRLRPERAEVHNSLGLVLARLGRLPEAIAEYDAVLGLNPKFAQAHNNLANALVRTPGREAEAIAHYRSALALEPDYWEVHFNLGLALAVDPNGRAEAIAHFESVLRLRPDCEPAREMIEQLRAE